LCDKTRQAWKKKARAFAGGHVFQKKSHVHGPHHAHHTTRYTTPHNTPYTHHTREEKRRTE